MRAVTVPAYGGPEVLEVRDLPEPSLGAGQVLVRVAAAAVNPTDVLLREGRQAHFLPRPPPYVPGMDLAGTVTSPGETWADGDRVIGVVSAWRPSGGAQAELVAVDEASLCAWPPGVVAAEAATVPMNALTAFAALDQLETDPGDVVHILGAGGAVGSVAVELAIARGAVVHAVARSGDRDWLLDAGAAGVHAAAGEALAAAGPGSVLDATPGDPHAARELVLDGGRITPMRPYPPGEGTRLDVRPVFVPDHLGDTASLRAIGELLASGRIRPRVAMTVRPDETARAHRAFERRGLRGRPVVLF